MARRRLLFVVLVVLAIGAAWYVLKVPSAGRSTPPGGRLVATQRTEPNSYNRFMSPTYPVELVSRLINAPLVRVNRATGALEPALSSHWTTSPDGLTYTLHLRKDVRFSDGAPFTADDVLFSFRVLYDPGVASAIATGMLVGGKPLTVAAVDTHTVTITFPAPFGPGLSLLDSVPIIPRHKLAAALEAGTFGGMWTAATPPAELAGLGPFVVAEYQAGQRMRFTRNPYYWAVDGSGRPLPYLDELVLEFIPDQNAEMLRLEAGTVDLVTDQIRAEDYAALERAAAAGQVQLVEAGVSVDPTGLWFNLRADNPHARAKPWLQREELRKAISLAVDRTVVVNTVFLGAAEPAYGPITRGYGPWFVAELPHADYDPARATALLERIGLTDRNGDGRLDDPSGRPARFSVLTRKGSTVLERTLANVQEQLARIGLGLDIVALERNPMLGQWDAGDYEAMYYGAPVSSIDPSNNSDLWLSSGGFHFWAPNQPRPATAWEAQIDQLMGLLATTMDPAKRVAQFADVQRIFAEHEPIIYFAAPKVTIGMSARVTGAVPAVVQPQVLWRPETLGVGGTAR